MSPVVSLCRTGTVVPVWPTRSSRSPWPGRLEVEDQELRLSVVGAAVVAGGPDRH
jgi:hypothetical protein